MKITPLSSSMPSIDTGTQVHSQSAIDRAKAAFNGTQQSPSDTPIDPRTARQQTDVRRLQMRTNVTPERFYTPPEDLNASPNAISNNNGQTNAVTEETKPLSPQYAALARERRALQVRQRELEAREKAIQSAPSKNDGPDFMSRIKSEPLRVLQEAGVTYEQLTQAILENPSNPELEALRAEWNTFKEDLTKTQTEREQQQEQQALSDMRREAMERAAKSNDFKFLRASKSYNDVVKLIDRTYKASGELLSVTDAMTYVEAELKKEFDRIQGQVSPAQSQPQPQQQYQRPPMRTLTNRDNANPPMSAKQRAIAAFYGQYKR